MNKKLFKPNDNLMSQLFNLNKSNASQWYKEYLEYHKGKDQGINYIVGYFSESKANMLRKQFKII